MKDFETKETMKNEALQNLISTWMPEVTFSEEESQFPTVHIPPSLLHAFMVQLKSTKETQFD